jgi:hypothetical protein
VIRLLEILVVAHHGGSSSDALSSVLVNGLLVATVIAAGAWFALANRGDRAPRKHDRARPPKEER